MARRLVGIASTLGVGMGLGIALGASVARSGTRPILIGATKGGLFVADQAGRVAAEVRETAEDLYHEARNERAVERSARQAAEGDEADSAKTVRIPRSR